MTEKPKKQSVKKASGGQSTFTQEKANEIVQRVSTGEPLAQVCRDMKIGLTTWYDWVKARPELSESIARAREAGYDMIAAEALRIADTPVEGEEVEQDADGKVVKTKKGDMLGHRKLQIETRLKLLAKWDPKRYGEKLALGGADDLPPIKTMTDEQLAARVAALQKKVGGDE